MHSFVPRIALASLVLSIPFGAVAQSFTDVSQSSTYYTAVEYLKAKGIVQGYSDGTFRPANKVNRAEALKTIIGSKISSLELSNYTSSPYTDVPSNAWFLSYVEAGREKFGLIDGPPKATVFHGGRNVNQVEFLKMFFKAEGVDTASAYSDISLPLANDVLNTTEWYYPSMRYALASSMILVNPDGTLQPAKELTRGDVALLLHRFYTYREGRRTQALLSEAESEILNVLKMFDERNLIQAELASARSILASRGALVSKPDDPLVKGAVKTSEGFRLLVRAYEAGVEGRLQEVVAFSGEAWQLAEKAKEFSPGLSTVAMQMQTIAKNMADEARSLMGQ